MKKIALILMTISMAFAYTGDIKPQVQKDFDKAVQILKEQKDIQIATDEIFDFLEDNFNVKLMAMLSLGQEYKTLDTQKQNEYLNAFKKLLKKDFISKIGFYKNEQIIIQTVTQNKNKGQIHATLNYNGSDKNIYLKIAQTQENWLIYDIIVDDISLISTYRTQFASLYQNNTFEDFIKTLSK